ncbi:hypothetical protein QBC37DRAFT_293875 [Rhypophila decipiens]|uniref:DUF7820 domain-containing protein n=1 Tax=Rhypophila decipiens TaxID=261697 RepID=A0AAN6Y009_9PEZI|nr:hypothetical protein QBC37DRAFT_293875 [Rhypophila decipiens]
MDQASKKNSGIDRRVSTRSSMRISADIGNEEFGAGMIADGFRPPQPEAEGNRTGRETYLSSSSTNVADGSIPSSSIAPNSPPNPEKAAGPRVSFTLRHDGAMGPISQPSAPTRASSTTTDSAPFIQPDGPYEGPSGPSHPYQMYTQDVRAARTMSVTTSSTEPMSETSYAGPRGPAHPYGMYTQNTATDVPQVAPVTHFQGLPDQYQRRLGPEGEDIADMIGPDGHTEQLPPYTRYPDETYARKVRDAENSAEPATGGATVVREPAEPASPETPEVIPPGAGGIGLATRNPEFESTDNLDSPRSRHSARSFSSEGSDHAINTAAAAATNEKAKPLKPWQVWMRKRMWGIVPYWAILMTLVVLTLMVAILGSVIGTFMSRRYKPGRKDGYTDPNSLPSITATYDATPIPTPSDLPPLPTGSFGLAPLTPNRVSNTCFNDTTLSQAWNCYFVMASMTVTVDRKPESEGGEYTVALGCNQSATITNNVYAYGEQPPIVNPVSMELVTDLLEPNRGPAWFRILPYNKTVILPQHFLSPTGSSPPARIKARALRELYPRMGEFKRKGIAKPGDRPWVCNWPQTFLEIFIYPQQNSSWASFTGRPPPPPLQTSEGQTSGGLVRKRQQQAATTTPSTTSSTPTSPFGPVDTGPGFVPPLPPYPRVLKLEERRIGGAPMPDCTQWEIQEDGSAKPALDANGKMIVIQIVENEPPPPGEEGGLGDHSHPFIRRRESGPDVSQCGCMWFLT